LLHSGYRRNFGRANLSQQRRSVLPERWLLVPAALREILTRAMKNKAMLGGKPPGIALSIVLRRRVDFGDSEI